jgi:hypothetical protein
MIAEPDFISLVSSFSLTGLERIKCLYSSLLKTVDIEGDLVECGVFKGGNILGMAEFLHTTNNNNKTIFAYDTFTGMTEPSKNDINYGGWHASDLLQIDDNIKCAASIDDVKNNISSNTNYDCAKIRYVKGDIRQTLKDKNNLPEKISLLRLDTDFYDSTKIELEVLYPLMSKNSILIIDDYGHWQGCRDAVTEFFKDNPIDFQHIDYTCVCATVNSNY